MNTMAKKILIGCAALCGSAASSIACTGISLTAKDGSYVQARTIEGAALKLISEYVVIPRGLEMQSYTPNALNGLKFTAKYGVVGLCVVQKEFIAEGINEAGLSTGLFFFPNYGDYAPYKEADNAKTLCDMQFVTWVLSQFSSISQVKDAIKKVNLVTLNSKIGAVHWRITEPSGKMVVLEVVGGVPHFYDNPLGVITNAPGFQWHMTNLDNYINLEPGTEADRTIKPGVVLQSLGHGSGNLGLPGDFTSPSRFVRAAFFQTTAPVLDTGFETVTQAFHILNNFDIPIGSQHVRAEIPKGLPSGTQFTAATDLKAMKLYYRTAWNSNIRCIDLIDIDFHKVKYQSHPLDKSNVQPVEIVRIH